MVAMGMGSTTKRGVVWCAGLLVAGLLLAAVEADYCSEDCRGKLEFMACVRRCRSQVEVGRSANCVALCHGKPNFMACCNSHRYARRAALHLLRAGGESTTHEEEASGGAVVGVLTAPAPSPCEVFCHDRRADWGVYQRCLDTCRLAVYARQALLCLKLDGRESATHEEVLTAMAARLSDACQDLCHNHEHYDWCVRRCRFGPHFRLAGGESEGASGGAVDVPQVVVAAAAGAQPMKNTDPCEDYCVEQTRYFPRPGQFFDCVEECHAGHGRLAGDGGNGILPAGAAVAAQHEAAAGAQPVNTETCESYCKRHARDFPAKYTACVRQCQAGGHPGDGARVEKHGARSTARSIVAVAPARYIATE